MVHSAICQRSAVLAIDRLHAVEHDHDHAQHDHDQQHDIESLAGRRIGFEDHFMHPLSATEPVSVCHVAGQVPWFKRSSLMRQTPINHFRSASLQQRVDARFFAAESLVQGHRVFGATAGEDVLAKRLGDLRVKDVARFLERLKSIGVQHFGPQIRVVTGRVAAGKDVLEVGAAVARDDLRDQPDLVQAGLLEGQHIDVGIGVG